MKISKFIKAISFLFMGIFLATGLAFAGAKTDAASKNKADGSKAVVMVVSSHSCPMCVEFENRVLNNPEVQKSLEKFTLKKVDVTAAKVHVEVTPTVIIYDKNKKQIRKFVPSLDKSKFINILTQVEK